MKLKASYHQERLWFIHRFEYGDLYKSGPVYHNIPLVLEIEGVLDINLLELSLNTVINRHEALRTRMLVVEEELFQLVEPEVELKIQVLDSAGDGSSEPHQSFLEMAIAESKRPFFQDGKPLIRAALLKISSLHSMLVITLHHLVSDRCSLDIIAAELAQCYQALRQGVSPGFPGLALHYADFSQWQLQLPQDFLKSLFFYWKKQVAHLSPLELPITTRRAAIHTFREGRVSLRLPAELGIKMKAFRRQKGTGSDVLLLAAFKVLLHRYCGQEDIVVGTSTDNRRQPDTEGIVGPLANLLVLRSSLPAKSTFNSYFSNLNQTLEQAYENRDIPFDLLAQELNPQKDMSRTVFFDVLFQYREQLFPTPSIKDLEMKYIETNLGWGKYDLNFLIWGEDDSFAGILVYNKDYYDETLISRLVENYKILLESILREPDRQVSQLEILTGDERRKLLVQWNQTDADYPTDKTIHQLFAEQVEKTPGTAAVVYRERLLTYRELDAHASRLAAYLREHYAVVPGDLIGIMVERCEKMIAGLLGILKAGGAYVPIDPHYPDERKEYILKDSNVKVLLTGQSLDRGLQYPAHTSHLPAYSSSLPIDSAPAYIIYTSGTTGRPKGCIITHRNLVRLFKNERLPFHFDQADTWVMAHSFCFDFSVWEMYGALLNGGRLIVPPLEQVRDVKEFLGFIKKHKVTVLNQTPQAFYTLVELKKKSPRALLNNHLRCVIFGGDKLLPHYLTAWIDRYSPGRIQLVNMYGITETTVHVTHYRLKESDVRSPQTISPIGRPLPETTLYILDGFLNPVPVGAAGECYVGGSGVAQGYLNRVLLTADRFLENPHKPGEIIYKSGDLCRWLPDGTVEYLGRNDDQVQVRGFRIEPAEIESHLRKHPAVKEAVVVSREDKDHQTCLCAYIRLIPGESMPDLRNHLSGTLPGYMIPAYMVPVNAIPLTANGKVDKKALPDHRLTQTKQSRIPPRDRVEETLAKIWAEVLGMKKEVIGIEDDFFELGGHSLKATILIERIHQQLDVKVPLMELFRAPKLRELAAYAAGIKKDKYAAIAPVEEKEYYPLSPAQKRMYILQQMLPGNTTYNMPQIAPFDFSKERDWERLEESLKKLVNRHESLRTSFESAAGEPVQRVRHEVEFHIDYFDFAQETDAVKNDAVNNFIRPFDLSRPPLFRVGLIKEREDRHFLVVDMHHIISDGVSNEILIRDFNALYEGRQLQELRIQYKDFAQWLHRPEVKEAVTRQENYWLKKFRAEIPLLDLPIDYPRPKVQSFEGDLLDFEIPPPQTRLLESIASAEGATLYMVLLAVMNILFSKLSGREDIIIGSPVAGRRHADLEKIIGMFVNTLALWNYPKGEKTFNQFLKEVKENTLQAFENQEYPFEDLVEKIEVDRDAGRNPLFDVMFALQTFVGQDLPAPDQVRDPFENSTAKFDLTVVAVKAEGDKLPVSIQYCTKLFKKETIERFITYLKKIISSVTAEPGMKLAQIEIISGEEKRKLLHDFNDTGETYPRETTLPRLFRDRAGKTPDSISLVCDREENREMVTLTYRELNGRADRLARLLIEKGVKENHLVGLLADRSVEMIVGMLGILKAGGAYIPLNPKAPALRNEYILEECGTGILVTENRGAAPLSGLDKNIEVIGLTGEIIGPIGPIGPIKPIKPILPTHLCYVIFTSGSTG
ncbi:MAG: amino acid adenylation domain-containing protein, partial [bacterium]|nr:amino acid adenylation domain-containing protein [bacterium]